MSEERKQDQGTEQFFSPSVDISECETSVVITADVPGVDDKSVDISVEKNVLTIKGYVNPEIPDGFRLAHEEYGLGNFRRSFTLANVVDREKIEAKIKNGVLTLALPKSEGAKARKITVQAAA